MRQKPKKINFEKFGKKKLKEDKNSIIIIKVIPKKNRKKL